MRDTKFNSMVIIFILKIFPQTHHFRFKKLDIDDFHSQFALKIFVQIICSNLMVIGLFEK